jgi:hypothetical protein
LQNIYKIIENTEKGFATDYKTAAEVCTDILHKLNKNGILADIKDIDGLPVPVINGKTLSDMDKTHLTYYQMMLHLLSLGGAIGKLETMSTKRTYGITDAHLKKFEDEWRNGDPMPDRLRLALMDRLVYKTIGYYENRSPSQNTKLGQTATLFGRFYHERFVDQTRGTFERAKYYQSILKELKKDKEFDNFMKKSGIPIGDFWMPNWKKEVASDIGIGAMKVAMSRPAMYLVYPVLANALFNSNFSDIIEVAEEYLGAGSAGANIMTGIITSIAAFLMSEGETIEPLIGKDTKINKPQMKSALNTSERALGAITSMLGGYGIKTGADIGIMTTYLASKYWFDQARYEFGTADMTMDKLEDFAIKQSMNVMRGLPVAEIIPTYEKLMKEGQRKEKTDEGFRFYNNN